MLSLREAFDLTPRFDMKLGERSFSVPPLTFGRFQEVLACDFGVLREGIAGFDPALLQGTPEEVGRRLAYFPIKSFAKIAEAAVPGLSADEWEKSATPFDLFELFIWFGKTHDWKFITEAINFGEPREPDEGPGPSMIELSATLLGIAKELGCMIQDVLDFRVEGFFLSGKSITERYRSGEEKARQQSTEEMWAQFDLLDAEMNGPHRVS